MLETERKLQILTPLLWPSRCVFVVLLDAQPEVLGSTPSGLFRGPPRSGVAFPNTSGLYCLEVCWQLHRGFPRAPSVGCGLPYHISSLTLWESAGNCIRGFRVPLGRVWPSLPHLVSNSLGVCWQLHRGFSECPLCRVWPSLPHLDSTVWNSPGNCFGTPNSTELNNNSTPTRSPTGSLNRMFNRHHAEITVMQFRGYSLPVHDCNVTMRPSPCPIS